ncbi:hypothetical protein [Flavobacterium proteolyticum]|uniref:Uncharacterized protein n=1 Tax=Flavobacterium proteolyticum TaxID=2911683 RepID=A0ABR9WNL6_9FLAO|nr:hypothetical protein [Flavobacterium proteolyticum]MBE9575084.1 hypothetical protein [Flavobacterium proteolyticum]
MENAKILVYDKYDLYFDSIEEMADNYCFNLNFHDLKKSKDFQIKSKKHYLFFIVYDPEDFYILFEKKINIENLIIATKNHNILNYLENTFHIKYVDLNLRHNIVRNLSKTLSKGNLKNRFAF